MKKLTILLCIATLLLATQITSAQNVPTPKSVTGSWIGKISPGAITLRIIFNLSLNPDGTLAATMDSPDQGAKGIPLGLVTLKNNTLTIAAEALAGNYSGTIKNDTLIEGVWQQGGASTPLNLTKLKTVFALNRPQEPKPPFPYAAEDVTFNNSKFNINLAGTITTPAGTGPFPAIIMVTGSGAQNRDEELMGHKPFWVIADYFSRKGYIVLRYDDRGVGKSQGNYADATSADLATDAEAAFKYLLTNSKVDPKAIGIMGHSEGGLIAPIAASANPDIAFIIALAGPGFSGDKIIYRQSADISRMSGVSEAQISENIAANKKMFAILKKEPDNDLASEKMTAAYKKILVKKKATPEEIDNALKQLQPSIAPAILTWFRYFVSTDPARFWKQVNCPVLALNGELDLQVAWEPNLTSIEKVVKKGGNNSVTTKHFPGLNHLFQPCKTGLPNEYGEIETTFSPEVLDAIDSWLTGLYPLKKTDMLIGK